MVYGLWCIGVRYLYTIRPPVILTSSPYTLVHLFLFGNNNNTRPNGDQASLSHSLSISGPHLLDLLYHRLLCTKFVNNFRNVEKLDSQCNSIRKSKWKLPNSKLPSKYLATIYFFIFMFHVNFIEPKNSICQVKVISVAAQSYKH